MSPSRRLTAREAAEVKASIRPVSGETAAERLRKLAGSDDLDDFFAGSRVYEEGRATPEYVAQLERELSKERGEKTPDRRVRRKRSPHVDDFTRSQEVGSEPEGDSPKAHGAARVLLELPHGELTDAWDMYVAKKGLSARKTLQELVIAELRREADRQARARRAARKRDAAN